MAAYFKHLVDIFATDEGDVEGGFNQTHQVVCKETGKCTTVELNFLYH